MSERMTTIELGKVGGFRRHGRQTPAEMIATYRRYAEAQLAEAQLAEAQAVLAAPDDAFRVYTHTGVHCVRHIEVLQEGSES